MAKTITMSADDARAFIDLYNKSIENQEASFLFRDEPVLVAYAKYVIEYFNMQGLLRVTKKPNGTFSYEKNPETRA